jgi:hypothetical protein
MLQRLKKGKKAYQQGKLLKALDWQDLLSQVYDPGIQEKAQFVVCACTAQQFSNQHSSHSRWTVSSIIKSRAQSHKQQMRTSLCADSDPSEP